MVIYVVTKIDSKGNLIAVEGAYDNVEFAHAAIVRYEKNNGNKRYEHIVIQRSLNRDYYR